MMLAPSPPRVLAEVHDYAGLHGALRARSDELAVSRAELDSLSGLQSGYCGKLLAPVPIKRIGYQSLGPLLTVLGVKLIMVEDSDALRRIGPRLKKRNDASVRYASGRARKKRPKRPELDSAWGKFMAARRVLSQSPSARSQIAKRAAVIRWADVKAVARASAKQPKPKPTRREREDRLRLVKPNG
jgi:hypothetical protein